LFTRYTIFFGVQGGPKKMKGQVRIQNIRLVEKVEDDEEFEKRPNVFQVSSRVAYVALVVVCKLVEVNR
jgi:hypothetical protein